MRRSGEASAVEDVHTETQLPTNTFKSTELCVAYSSPAKQGSTCASTAATLMTDGVERSAQRRNNVDPVARCRGSGPQFPFFNAPPPSPNPNPLLRPFFPPRLLQSSSSPQMKPSLPSIRIVNPVPCSSVLFFGVPKVLDKGCLVLCSPQEVQTSTAQR